MKNKKKIIKLQEKISLIQTRHMLQMSDLKIALGNAKYRADIADTRSQLLSLRIKFLEESLEHKTVSEQEASTIRNALGSENTNEVVAINNNSELPN